SALRNPGYSTNLIARYTQPLLRNLKTDSTRTSLLTTRISQQVADINLRATIVNTEASIRNAYWDLVFAVQAVEAARRSLDLAEKLVQDNRMRVEIGTMAPIDVVQAEAEAASRRQALVQQEATRRTTELALKRLIVGGTEDELWRATLNPTDRPGLVAEPIDLEGAVRNALQSRTDLSVARKTLDSNDLSIRNLHNQTLPSLDLVTNYQLQGRGGTEFRRAPGSLGGAILQTFPGGYLDALRGIRGVDAPTWSFALNLSYPIGRSAADANLARARLQLQQTQAQIKQVELQIATDVTSAALAVRNSQEAVQAATSSRELFERRLDAQQSKFEVGMSTNYEVVQAQRDLADAQNSELRALLNYRKALVDFQRVQITGNARSVTAIAGGGGGGATTGATGTAGGGSGFTGGGGLTTGGGGRTSGGGGGGI
ncbi:MAG: TolC family protein, partial [Acidobacteria bacterium]|nr:TolC family protein [Acidobacteriota bacterium]